MPSVGGPMRVCLTINGMASDPSCPHLLCVFSMLASTTGAAHALPTKGRTDAQRQRARDRRADGVRVEVHNITALLVPKAALRCVWASVWATIRFPVGGGRNAAGVGGRDTKEGGRTRVAVCGRPGIACKPEEVGGCCHARVCPCTRACVRLMCSRAEGFHVRIICERVMRDGLVRVRVAPVHGGCRSHVRMRACAA